MNTSEDKHDGLVKVLIGFSVIGDVVRLCVLGERNETAIKILPFVLMGHYDLELRMAIYNKSIACGEVCTDETKLNDPRVTVMLERLKQWCRDYINKAVVELTREERENARRMMQQEFQQHNSPHPAGTIAELAAKLGVSKSEVRRLKSEGKLDTALAAKEQA